VGRTSSIRILLSEFCIHLYILAGQLNLTYNSHAYVKS
jgi:hypothetical protein